MTDLADVLDPTGEPPHDLEAERAVLGALLLQRDSAAEVVDVLRPEDFYRPAHQIIFETIMQQYGLGNPTDVISTYDALRTSGHTQETGGLLYLHEMTEQVLTVANIGWHAKIVAERAVLRRLVESATRIHRWALNPAGMSPQEVAERSLTEVEKVTRFRGGQDYAPLSDIMPEALDQMEAASQRGGKLTGVPTGFIDLDELTHGLQDDQMIVVAARPAVGKSTIGLDFSRSAAIKCGMPTAIFSLEMSRYEIVQRLLSAESKTPLHHIRKGTLGDDDWTRIAKTMARVSTAPLFIDDSPNLTMSEITAKATKLHAQHGLRLIVIDYLQLMKSGTRAESRQNEVSDISRAIKLLAKKLSIPIVAISQLNRGPEQRTDKKPQVSDLRESGSIEQDSDMVLLLHRDDVSNKESPRAGEADIIVGKHRNGPTTTLTVAFQGHYSRFVDMAQH